jgi:hypothetical protein
MKSKYLFALVTASLFLSACGATSNSTDASAAATASSSPAEESGFSWTTDLLYQAMMDPELVESWGYKVGVGDSAVDDFAIDANNRINDNLTGVKPADCEDVFNFSLSRNEIGAKYYSVFDHFDQYAIFDIRSFLLYTYTFESEEKAKQIFAQLNSSADSCGRFSYLKGSEVLDMELWETPSVNQPDLIIGNDGDITATAFGLNGSAIWGLQVINAQSSNDAEATATLAAAEINQRLNTVQGK